jgi:SAM-dependent methyltransferase
MTEEPNEYYSRRAREYERVYHRDDSARQREQVELADALKEALQNRCVLEITCGTGYWTEAAAQVARYIVATDASPEMLAVAAEKGLPAGRVEFRLADAYDLAAVSGSFDAGLAGFWLSHVPKGRMDAFLDGLHARLSPGSVVFMADNVYVPGVGGELLRKPDREDTFKLRTLSDGTEYEVLKNYYSADQLRRIFAQRAINLEAHIGKCFWWITYEIN